VQVIEAHYLFGAGYDDIDIVIHPQSIIHSAIETLDCSMIAQVLSYCRTMRSRHGCEVTAWLRVAVRSRRGCEVTGHGCGAWLRWF
jgi:hypothetical protein